MDNNKWFKTNIKQDPEVTKKEKTECSELLAEAETAGVSSDLVSSMSAYFRKNDRLTGRQKKYLEDLINQRAPDNDTGACPENSKYTGLPTNWVGEGDRSLFGTAPF